MQPLVGRNGRSSDLRLALERLVGLPLRPVSARAVVDLASASPSDPELPEGSAPLPRFLELDPGLASGPRDGGLESLLWTVANRAWWQVPSKAVQDALESLWKHAVATSLSARRLAVEAGRSDADDLARAGLLNQLGLWALAAVSPDRLLDLLSIGNRTSRRRAERELLGCEASALGARLAERWGLPALVVASAWLHGDLGSDLNPLCRDAEGLELIQKAYLWAERTPWGLFPSSLADPGPGDPRLKILVAEVQVRCSAGLTDPEASPREEALSRSHADLTLRFRVQSREMASQERLLRAMTEGHPDESPEVWSDRVARLWCEEPGIASAQVVWQSENEPNGAPREEPHRAAPHVIPLGSGSSELRLWTSTPSSSEPVFSPLLTSAWGAWTDLIAHSEHQARAMHDVISNHRSRRDRAGDDEKNARLDALAEFAAGAGHELNNPLAVILGRAQLLIPKVSEPDATRSLRIIINQAQRAHRILRDLMYVARPPQQRPRPCQPDEILRASIRDLKPEAEARGIRIVSETINPVPVAWADPDPLRHLADVLMRNALESTPLGGTIRVTSGRVDDRIRWTVRDTGRGISPREGVHLFDPFFCGRQAGRGLGLGLPRVARFASQVGGSLTWRSQPGEGSVFRVELPIQAPADVG